MLRRLLAALAVALVVAPFVPSAEAIVHAADGLSVTTTTTYTINAGSGVVHVHTDLVLTNQLPNRVEGYTIYRRYFNGFVVPAPAASANPVARSSSGRNLGVSRRNVPDVTDYVLYDISFPNLFYKETIRIGFDYDITGLAPRSDNPSRVNAAYAAFDAFGVGDEGRVTVRVVVPSGFVVDLLGSDAVQTQEGGNTVYTATNISKPDEFTIFVSARNDKALVATSVTTGDGDAFELKAWPGDAEWQSFMTTQIQDGVPELVTLIGRPWPIDGTLDVVEAYTPYLYGYAGWFSSSKQKIEIGEDLDQEVALHELSHAWFNEDWFADRWLNEGMAQVYSNKAVDELGGTPKTPDPIVGSDPGKVVLNDWGDPTFDDRADDVEAYGYNASFSVVKDIVDEIGDDGMRQIFAAVDARTNPYVGDLPAEELDTVADWRRFLDLAEELGSSKKALDLVTRYVADAAQKDLLDERADARTAYAALREHGGEWAPPVLVREKMGVWSFKAAHTAIDDATAVLDLRDTLDTTSKQLGVTYPGTFETDYEAVDKDFTDVTAELQAQLDAADAVVAAVAADAKDDGFFGGIGLWGTDLPGELADARAALSAGDTATAAALAAKVTATVADASDVGTTRFLLMLGGVLLLILLILVVILLIRRRRRRARDAAAAAAATGDEAEAEADGPVAETEPGTGQVESTPDGDSA